MIFIDPGTRVNNIGQYVAFITDFEKYSAKLCQSNRW